MVKTFFKKHWGVVSIVVVILIVASAAFVASFSYWSQFHNRPLSESPEQWGQFGDYVGGTLNPAISLIGLVLTFWIAVQVNKISKKTSKEQIAAQKEILKLQLQSEVIKEFLPPLDKMLKGFITSTTQLSDLDDIETLVSDFHFNYGGLFPAAQSILTSIAKTSVEMRKDISDDNIKDADTKYNQLRLSHITLEATLRRTIFERLT